MTKTIDMKLLLPLFTVFILGVFSCTDSKQDVQNQAKINELKLQVDSLKSVLSKNEDVLKNRMITSLTFQDNRAESAMNFYVDIFNNSEIIQIQRWGREGPGTEGKIMQATFSLNGNLFMCSDSPPVHTWNFSPAVSTYIECESDSMIENLFSKLSEKGETPMPLNNYGFSQKFGWVIDQYGVSWQLNLQ